MPVPRRMRLTPELVARVPAPSGGIGALPAELSTDEDHRESAALLLRGAPDPGAIWLFAYGSLIWNPACDFVDQRIAIAHGWRRSFCLGWDRWFRGCVERPGLMLALDRGGQCAGVAYRLPADTIEAELEKLARREMRFRPSARTALVPRWIGLRTIEGPLRALAFVVNPASDRYVRGMAPERLADILASASGPRGSMAEYLCSTVGHLEDLRIHDRHLWHLQDLVADRLEAASPA